MYDVIIIGAGPAGISASLYTDSKKKFKNINNIQRKNQLIIKLWQYSFCSD